MDVRVIDEGLHVAPQIALDDLSEAARRGYGAVISNRPDDEEPGQPSARAVQQAAQAAGLAFVHIPVSPGQLGEGEIAAFRHALDDLPGPVLAFCRSGTRSAMLWALSEAGRRPVEDILSRARDAGYDLSPLRPRLDRG